MRRLRFACVGVLASLFLLTGAAWGSQVELYHVAAVDLGLQFSGTSGYGDNPLSVAFDGTSAYVGGYNNSAAAATIGVVKVADIFGGGTPVFTLLANTQFSSPSLRGLDALAYESGTASLLMAHDSGLAATSFVSRRNASDGSTVWTFSNPQGTRPVAMAIDPVGASGGPGVAFLNQGSGRRRLLSLADGTTVYDGATGGIILTDPDSGSTWRAMAFDTEGNIVVANQGAYGYGVRNTVNQWKKLTGTLDRTTRSVLKNVAVNNVGQGIVIMEDTGSDLLALSGRGMAQFTDSLGGITAVDKTDVHIRKLDGSAGTLTQIALNGDENGIGTPWTGEVKNLAFGYDAVGRPVLLVVDFVGRRLDVYVPEPATLGLLGIGGLVLLGRRRHVR